MARDRRRIEEIYHAVLMQPDEDRGDFLARECGDQLDLRREVESLLAQISSTNAPPEQSVVTSGPALSHISEMRSGQQLGVYQISTLIGSGGMGQVYRAYDPRLRRDVAIKVITARFATDPTLLK